MTWGIRRTGRMRCLLSCRPLFEHGEHSFGTWWLPTIYKQYREGISNNIQHHHAPTFTNQRGHAPNATTPTLQNPKLSSSSLSSSTPSRLK